MTCCEPTSCPPRSPRSSGIPRPAFAFGEFEHVDADGRVLEAAVVRDKMTECALARTPLAQGWSLIAQPELARGFLYRNFISPSGVTVRKSVLEAVGGFDESLVYSEDLDLWFRLAHHSSALYRDAVGHSYRVAPGSLTYRPSLRTARDRLTVLQRERARRATRAERRQLDHLLAPRPRRPWAGNTGAVTGDCRPRQPSPRPSCASPRRASRAPSSAHWCAR